MKKRVRKFDEINPIEFLLLRQKLGFGKYRKVGKRDNEKLKILLRVALERIQEIEKDDFIEIGERKRRVKV